MRKLSRQWLVISGVAIAALVLTILRPSPTGLIGIGHREVRAAPGVAQTGQKHNLAALNVINKTLIRVQKNYVDPSRIDPQEMLFAALDSVQYNIPEVLIKPDRVGNKVTIYVNDKRQTFGTGDIDSPWRLSKVLKRIFRFMELNMNKGADLAEVEYAAANGILGTLDPHSALLDPEQAREMNVSTEGNFSGLGIVIGMRDKKLTVVKPMPNTPASRAGIVAKDHIIKIDNDVTENLTLAESVKRMRGAKGSKVTLWVERDKESQQLRFDLVRDRIAVASVVSKLLANKVGYIKIKQFSSPTGKETRRAVRDLTASGAKSFVLDLRSNPGGLLRQAIHISDIFVDRGTIVTTVGGQEREAHRAKQDTTITRAPLAVLVNSNSASASEIVAGALKNLDRAIIIGDTSFGKGSVQILYDNNDGSTLKLTIAQYLTPGDLSIQGFGITPDIALQRMHVPEQNTGARDYLRLLPPSKSYRERDLRASLRSEYGKAGDLAKATLGFVYKNSDPDSEENDTVDEDTVVEDFEIRFARDFIAKYGKANRRGSMQNIDKALLAPRAEQEKRLADTLLPLGVDWTKAPANHPASQVQAHFSVVGGTSTVAAGSSVHIKGSITNTGQHAVYRAHARVHSADYAFDDTEFVFGKIPPGATKTWTAHIKLRNTALDRLDYLKFDITDDAHSTAHVSPLKLQVKAAPRPVFAYSHQLLDQGNGDGLVQTGEEHRLRIQVKNSGIATAEDTVAILRNASGTNLVLKKARVDLDSLQPGEEKTLEFVFAVADKTDDDVVVVELQVYDRKLGATVTEKLKYIVHSAAAGPKRTKGLVRVSSDTVPIYEGASSSSATIAVAQKGTVLRVNGKHGPWLRVNLSAKGNRPGFIQLAATQKTKGDIKLAGLQLKMQVTPPVLQLQVPRYETDGPTYALAGTALDDSKVEDVYVFVSNQEAQIDNRKVFYKSNRHGNKSNAMQFLADIPLWPGSNMVTVVARESTAVFSVKTLYLNRTAPKTAAKSLPQ